MPRIILSNLKPGDLIIVPTDVGGGYARMVVDIVFLHTPDCYFEITWMTLWGYNPHSPLRFYKLSYDHKFYWTEHELVTHCS
jgi:hypothetical protein